MVCRSLTLPAPAKLNINLRILGRRADGLHEIDSVMTLVDFADSVSVARREDGRIVRRWSHPQVRDDLCARAARLLQRVAGARAGADIAVQKKIPVGGGLGGGSSNAASVLLALNVLWQTRLRRGELRALAAKIGADAPFFIFRRPARARGAGERLADTKISFLQKYKYYLLVFPNALASSAKVYAEYENLTSGRAKRKISGVLINNVNHLAEAVFHLHPPVAEAARILRRAAGEARLSGGGACVYAAFSRRAEARAAQAALPAGLNSAVAAAWRRGKNDL
ncbi:MAG: 4-(cytidine 5'-diphospho)-2-C-methyl-D-erythritol kinase [Gammaproteobacteria bacterium]